MAKAKKFDIAQFNTETEGYFQGCKKAMERLFAHAEVAIEEDEAAQPIVMRIMDALIADINSDLGSIEKKHAEFKAKAAKAGK